MCVNLSAMSYGSQGEDTKYGRLDHLRAYAGAYYLNTTYVFFFFFTCSMLHWPLGPKRNLQKSFIILTGLMNSVFTTNKKPDVLMNTNQLDYCLKVIEATMEYPSDEYLIQLVKIQQLAQTISMTMAGNGMAPPMSLPLIMVIQSFQDQLDTFRASIPPRLAHSCMYYVKSIYAFDLSVRSL